MNNICTGGILLNENSSAEKGNCSVSFNYLLERFYSKTSKQSDSDSDSSTMSSSAISTKYREEEELKLLNAVRYNETLCTPNNLNSSCSKEKATSLKIMTYNVLSQTLLEEHRYLYRNGSPVTLKWQYRYPRILGQIIQQNPDILCLQEVQEDHVDFFDTLLDLGFAGVYKKRTGGKVDGCSIYYRANMFDLVSESKLEYFKSGVKELNRDNVGLVVRLFWWAGNRHVTVANTHLLYNPRKTDVRLAQISLLLSELNLLTDFGRQSDVVFLTGDLNSDPKSDVVKLLTSGYLADSSYLPFCQPNFSSVQNINGKSNDYEEELNQGAKESSSNPSLQMCHNFKFRSVYPHWTQGDTEATTFQDQWLTADYIFYSLNKNNLRLSSRLRLPTAKECSENIKKLPNYASPSDHLPLVATFLLGLD